MGDDGRGKEALISTKDKAYSGHFTYEGEELKSLRSCLKWACIDQSNKWRASLSWSVFFLLAICVPLCSNFLLSCSTCDSSYRRPYDAIVQLSLSSVATLSFISLSSFARKYGLRKFLFLDKLCDESEKVRQGYTQQLHSSVKVLLVFVLPCFAAESAYKIWWYSSAGRQIPYLINIYLSDIVACTLELYSWIYRTSIFFLVCVLFRLICYLHILRMEDFAKVFQAESDVESILKEYLRIRRHLRIISHRFRAFILSTIFLVTASQFNCLLDMTRSNREVNITKAGELALCSITLVTGLCICLRSATKITHKAQAVTSLAAKWHVCATINSFDTTDCETPSAQIASQRAFNSGAEWVSDDDEDGEDELDNTKMIFNYTNTISFQKRQALVTYLENNKAGITVYGFMMDRTWLHTIFGIQLSLVLWLLGKTIGIS